MKAVRFLDIGRPLEVAEVAMPVPGQGQVLLKVDRCGICGSDLHMTEDPVFCVPSGAILGHEIAATVIDKGPDVATLRLGDRVSVLPISSCGQCASCLDGLPAYCEMMQLHGGGFAENMVAHERQCIRLPVTLSTDDGALVEPLAVGLHGAMMGAIRPGARVLIVGAGPVGLATAFWARKLGARQVAVTASSRQREELALHMGADVFLDPATWDQPDVLAEAFGKRGPDIVFECVGKAGLIMRCVNAVRRGGKVILLGLCTSPDQIAPLALVTKEVCVQAAVFYSLDDFENAARVLDSGNVEPRAMITDHCGLDELPAAFEQLRDRSGQCKVMVAPNG